MQRHRHILGEKPDDLHVARVVAARHQIVFGPDEIESDQARFRADQRGGGGGLDEHLVGRVVAVDLDDIAEGDTAAGLCVGGIACQRGADLAEGGRQVVAFRRDAFGKPACLECREL